VINSKEPMLLDQHLSVEIHHRTTNKNHHFTFVFGAKNANDFAASIGIQLPDEKTVSFDESHFVVKPGFKYRKTIKDGLYRTCVFDVFPSHNRALTECCFSPVKETITDVNTLTISWLVGKPGKTPAIVSCTFQSNRFR
jgi:hypothetical protein